MNYKNHPILLCSLLCVSAIMSGEFTEQRLETLNSNLKQFRGTIEFRQPVGFSDPGAPIVIIPTGEELFEDPYNDDFATLRDEITYVPLLKRILGEGQDVKGALELEVREGLLRFLEDACEHRMRGEKMTVYQDNVRFSDYGMYRYLPASLQDNSLFEVIYQSDRIPLIGGFLKALRHFFDDERARI